MLHQSYLAAVERNVVCSPGFASEPYEAAWASEALFYVRALDGGARDGDMSFVVEISPDGMRWVKHGSSGVLGAGEDMVAIGATHFGSWLRLRRTDSSAATPKVIVYLDLK